MTSSLRITWCILRTSIEERLVYRADFAFATLVRFLPIVTQVFLWGAIYQATGPRDTKVLSGYTYG
ncbi:MAG: ABC transporter permease, partial [Candidatus Saccharimonas sp.]|nr:ABC transporter permease [Planctomycetaceae bacterium]